MSANEYVIILKNENLERKKKAVAGDNTNTDSAVAKNKDDKEPSLLKTSLVAWNKVKPFVNQVVSHEINMVRVETGASEYTQKLQFAQQVAGSVLGTVESVLMGIAVGGVGGALVGLVTDVTAKTFDLAMRQDELNRSKIQEQRYLNLNVVRTGTMGSRGK
jgi:hypothetical protein